MVTQSYVIFCTSGSVVWIIPNVTNIFTKLNPLKGVRNIYTNEELQRMEFKDAFCKKFKLLVDRFSSFAKHRKLVEKMIHQKKNRNVQDH